MLGRWFNKWNAENPTDIYGPAVLWGGIGVVVIALTLLITWGQPWRTTSLQTGPRGTGMSVTKFASDAATPDPALAMVMEDPPWIPEGGEELAGDVYQNVQVLGDLTVDNFGRLMNAITRWVSPEEGCAYCHGDGDIESYAGDNLYTKTISRRMIQMTQTINENWDGHVNLSGMAGVTCYTCHRGQNVPSEIWFESTPTVEVMEGWSANQNLVTPVSQRTSLPSDALTAYLLEGEPIAVHDLESRVHNEPGEPLIQQTERTYSLMNHFSNALDANCNLCHNSRAFYDGAQITPQWATASLGIQMVLELNNDWLVPLGDLLPPERLGPLHADAPKAACATCHKGYLKPLQGYHAIRDWPELAASGPPVYE